MKRKKLGNAGFTLIELLAVITIMGILMMVAIPAVSRTIENSRRDSFATVAQNYINTVRNSVLADEVRCTIGGKNIVASATPNGTYYYRLDTSDASTNTYLQQTTDLMESGGNSPWGGAAVNGTVYWIKEESTIGGSGSTAQNTTKTTYYIKLADTGKHGIDVWTQDQQVKRNAVKTNNVELKGNDLIPTVASGATAAVECKLG